MFKINVIKVGLMKKFNILDNIVFQFLSDSEMTRRTSISCLCTEYGAGVGWLV